MILSHLWLPDYPFFAFLADVINLRFLLLLLLQTALFIAMYSALPNRKNRPCECVPGAVLASLGWQGFSAVFSLYVENFASLTNIYGSVYTLALAMLWLYLCLSLIFYSAAFNQYLENHKK
jgi:membrane protein